LERLYVKFATAPLESERPPLNPKCPPWRLESAPLKLESRALLLRGKELGGMGYGEWNLFSEGRELSGESHDCTINSKILAIFIGFGLGSGKFLMNRGNLKVWSYR